MQPQHAFTLYNASAGSGKTFNLVKAYLLNILQSTNRNYYRHLLAITFTNKAVGEMKSRVLYYLKLFSNPEAMSGNDIMLKLLASEIQISPEEIHQRAKTILHTILHNYAGFDITTIDGFTHRLIRTFAYDLNLPLNFEVELDSKALLEEAVERLIAKAGTNKKLTKVLVDFALQKANEDKSWDISYDFNAIAEILINENDLQHIKQLQGKTLDDFKVLKHSLQTQVNKAKAEVITQAQSLINCFSEQGITQSDFTSKYIYIHFKKLSSGDFNVSLGTVWQNNLNEKPLYKAKADDAIKVALEALKVVTLSTFEKTKRLLYHIMFRDGLLKNITPLSVIFEIYNSLEAILKEQNKVLISEFNVIVSNEIKAQPAPFIYERIGEKYKHFFIDEFQDTSVLQWENLIPLLQNTLAASGGSVLLVGDAKQAIYRWRGGQPEQFIRLFNQEHNPFQQPLKLIPLEYNYRSSEAIIQFNNAFFGFLSNVFSCASHQYLYEKSTQKIISEEKGYVNLSFETIDTNDDRNQVYTNAILNTIKSCLENGFAYGDICILTRFTKESIAVAEVLNGADIPQLSSRSLLLSESETITFIIRLLKLLINPDDRLNTVELLQFLSTHFNISDKHAFLSKHSSLSLISLFKSFEEYGVLLNTNQLKSSSLYNCCERIIKAFNLTEYGLSHVQFFLDMVLEYSQSEPESIFGFLAYYERKKSSYSVISTDQDAVQLMTIHAAKGLEFPVVIFPYADLSLYSNRRTKLWYPTDPQQSEGFSSLLINANANLEYFGENGAQLYEANRAEQELDTINLLYVALTRAAEHLYIISSYNPKKKRNRSPSSYAELLYNFVESSSNFNSDCLIYEYGNPKRTLNSPKKINKNTTKQSAFISNPDHQAVRFVTQAHLLWDNTKQEAVEKGNLIHEIMAQVNIASDVPDVLQHNYNSGKIDLLQKSALEPILNSIVKNPSIAHYFSKDISVYNELDIITPEGQIFRPDRIVKLANNRYVIIDYKTGVEKETDIGQINTYATLLQTMGLKVHKKIIIYINDVLTIKEF